MAPTNSLIPQLYSGVSRHWGGGRDTQIDPMQDHLHNLKDFLSGTQYQFDPTTILGVSRHWRGGRDTQIDSLQDHLDDLKDFLSGTQYQFDSATILGVNRRRGGRGERYPDRFLAGSPWWLERLTQWYPVWSLNYTLGFQCRGVLLLLLIVGQGSAVLAAGAGWVAFIFYISHLSSLSNVLSFGRRLNMAEILWFRLLKFNWQRFIFLFLHCSFKCIISGIIMQKTACKNSS